jgi:hypothetical protein
MKNSANQSTSSSEPWWASSLGALYFLLGGVGLMLNEIPHTWGVPAGLRAFDWLFFFGLLPSAIGFAAGWALGFPRWSYPYTGGLFVYSLYLMNTATPLLRLLGYENQGWGWRAWIPFLLACAVGFLLSWWVKPSPLTPPPPERSDGVRAPAPAPERNAAQSKGDYPPPYRSRTVHFIFFSNLNQDRSLASYAMFGWMPLLLFISFDEMDRLYTLIFMLIFTALMLATALLYQRLRRLESRTWALAGGVITSILLIEIGTIAYWLPLNGVNIPLSLAWGVFILAIMLSPMLFAHRTAPAPGVSGV